MSEARRGSRLTIVAGLGLALYTSFPAVAAAAPKAETDEAAATRIEQKALKAAVAGDQPAAITGLKQALRICEPPAACSARTKARLHMSLGTVRGVGEGDYDAAKKEFVLALALDPAARLRTHASRQLSTAFEEAKAAAGAPAEPAPPPEKPSDPPQQPKSAISELFHPEETTAPPPPPAPSKAVVPPADPATVPHVNWISLRAMVDFAFVSDANVCSPGAPSQYYCSDEGGARYLGRPQPNDDISRGFALSTARLVLGYERLLIAGLSAGAFAGFAVPFAGAPAGRSAMAPGHLEARASYAFGASPYSDTGDRFVPYAFVSLGAAQMDSHVVIRVNEVPCASKVAPACKRDLDVNRRAGNLFTSLGGGVRVRLEGRHALRAGARAIVVLGSAGGFALSPELVYELGL